MQIVCSLKTKKRHYKRPSLITTEFRAYRATLCGCEMITGEWGSGYRGEEVNCKNCLKLAPKEE